LSAPFTTHTSFAPGVRISVISPSSSPSVVTTVQPMISWK
ncbi:hypothetical protein NT07LI_2514a, partial [Listeria innocua FSL S4-378]